MPALLHTVAIPPERVDVDHGKCSIGLRGNFNAPQQQYAPNTDWQQRGYSNRYQGGQGSYGYGYSRGNSYANPDYRSYEPRYGGSYESRGWRERIWRERMWRERSRRHRWDW